MPTRAPTVVIIYYKGWGGQTRAVEINLKKPGLEAKKQLLQTDKIPPGIVVPPPQELKLIWKGNVLDDGIPLSQHGIKNWDTLMILFSSPPAP